MSDFIVDDEEEEEDTGKTKYAAQFSECNRYLTCPYTRSKKKSTARQKVLDAAVYVNNRISELSD